MVSNLLYERRYLSLVHTSTSSKFVLNWFVFDYYPRFGPYFVEPIVAGLDPKTAEPFLSTCDLIGNVSVCKDFAVIGTANEQLYGMCETLWRPNMVRKKDSLEVFLFKICNNSIIFLKIWRSLKIYSSRLLKPWWTPSTEMPIRVGVPLYTSCKSLIFLSNFIKQVNNFNKFLSNFNSEKDKVTVRDLKTRMD